MMAAVSGADERLLAMGVDGAPGGWVAVACWGGAIDVAPAGRRTELQFFRDIRVLARWRAGQGGGNSAPVAVDMPIGLPKVVEYRQCDAEARARLPWQQIPSVFQAPSRALLACATEPDDGTPPKAKVIFERARMAIDAEQARIDAEASEYDNPAEKLRRLTQQAAGILGKVAEIDEFLREQPAAGEPVRESWLIEVHPEMCFRAMAGGQVPPAKASAHGQLQRLDLARRAFPDADERIRTWDLGRNYSLLDICDAYGACWSAMRWALTDSGAVERRDQVSPPLEVLGETAPGKPVRDPATGLATRMVI